MTDKERIIIDIDRCKYRDKYTNFCLAEKDDIGETYTICTGTDCYFKQLSRKTAECEELKERLERIEEDLKHQCVDCMNINSDRYRKALEEIEEYFKTECVSCKEQYYNQHCEDCETQYFLDIISKAKDGK